MESSLWNTGIAMALYFAPILAMLLIVSAAKRFYQPKDRRNPLSAGLLRPVAHTLREQLDDVNGSLAAALTAITPLPLMLYVESSAQHNVVSLTILAVAALTGTLYFVVWLTRLVRKARDLRLGMDAEMAVGEELNTLMREGFWVFHDVPGDGPFNVDHVLVGPRGVFAVETKGRAKRIRATHDGHKVVFRDGKLEFPGWTETEPLAQARRNAAWLAKWLSSAVGETVQVQPVLAIAGWFIERKSRGDVGVISGKNPEGYFLKVQGFPLTDKQVQQIRHQLDQRCRDVVPRAYSTAPAKG